MSAPASLTVPSRFPATVAVGGCNPADLALIARPAIALAQWWRAPAVSLSAEDIAGFESFRLEGDAADAEAAVLDELGAQPARDWHAALAADVGGLVDRFAAIAGCDEASLRLEAVEGDACRRFHSDYTRLRLITTYAGPGTEWIVGDDPDALVHRIATGHVAIFKGRDPGPVGILHRSPPIAGTGRRRLVLVVDPLMQGLPLNPIRVGSMPERLAHVD